MKTVGAYEAKTRLSELLVRVEKGERITITRHGVPIAVLSPAAGRTRTAAEAVDDIRELRSSMRLDGLDIRELIAEGRR